MNERVKLIRKQLGMTQEQLAQRLGIGKAALSMIETGKAGLSARNRNILVQELNVNPEWLESGKGNMFNAEPDLTAYMHRTDNSLPLQSVPLYSIEGTLKISFSPIICTSCSFYHFPASCLLLICLCRRLKRLSGFPGRPQMRRLPQAVCRTVDKNPHLPQTRNPMNC